MKSMAATLHFTEILSALLKGKTSLADALYILTREEIERSLRDTAVFILSAMKKGKSLSDSLRSIKKGKVFYEPLYLTLISAAESAGNIETILERIAIDLKKKQRAKENVVNILIYPAIIVLLAVAGTIVILIKVIPFFMSEGLVSKDIVSDAITGIILAAMVLVSGGTALFTCYFRLFYYDSPEYRIFYLLDFLLRSKLTLSEALLQCALNLSGTKYGRALIHIKNDIASGMSFPAAFSKARHLPPYVLGWLSIAGEYGSISESCKNLSEHFARKDEKERERAAKLIEPAIIILTGIYLFIIMLTVILPILTSIGGII